VYSEISYLSNPYSYSKGKLITKEATEVTIKMGIKIVTMSELNIEKVFVNMTPY
tara:strand:+ start:61 stop:222 length:162 start_codon:yes stop_codon:yes gene_type:complete